MSEIVDFRKQALLEIEIMTSEIQKWQSDLKKDAASWRNEILREKNAWKQETLREYDRLIKEEVKSWRQGMIDGTEEWKQLMLEEIQQIKGGGIYGDKESIGKGTGSEDLLGPATGESDQVKTDDTAGRKGRSRPTGIK